jgi:uncharacterized alpha-E superfamily protein
VATPNGYHVLPGGLTRVAGDGRSRVIAMQRGGRSKDTWVLSDAPVNASFSLLSRTVKPEDLVASRANVPSRAAENLFWFGRYGERCDDLARLLRVALNAGLQEMDPTALPLAELGMRVGLSLRRDALAQDWCAAATLDLEHGLPANLRQLARVAYSLRERISLDHWRALNRLAQDPALGQPSSVAEALEWLDRVIQMMMTLSGFALDGMTRDIGWRFMSIGRRIERLSFSSLALNVALEMQDSENLAWLLELEDSIVTYRARQMGRMGWSSILNLLMFDETNPRSLMFQVTGIHDYLRKLEAALGPCHAASTEPLVAELRTLRGPGEATDDQRRTRTVALLRRLRGSAFMLSDNLTERFFAHADQPASTVLAV